MTNELYHHGVLGMHWGERRFQRENGTLTEKGKKRFEKVSSSERKKARETAAATRVLPETFKSSIFERKGGCTILVKRTPGFPAMHLQSQPLSYRHDIRRLTDSLKIDQTCFPPKILLLW